MKQEIRSKCTCGKEFIISLTGNCGRRDGKRVFPSGETDTGWDSFRCGDCHRVIAKSVNGAQYEPVFSQGVLEDGAVFLRDGTPMTVEEVLDWLRR